MMTWSRAFRALSATSFPLNLIASSAPPAPSFSSARHKKSNGIRGRTIHPTVLRRQHLRNLAHHLISRLINVLARNLLTLWRQHHRFTKRDSHRRAKLLQHAFTAPDRHRDDRHTGTQGDHPHAGMSFGHGTRATPRPLRENGQDIALLQLLLTSSQSLAVSLTPLHAQRPHETHQPGEPPAIVLFLCHVDHFPR